jgi:hypothetical protein
VESKENGQFQLAKIAVQSVLAAPAAVWLSHAGAPQSGKMSVHAGDGLVYIGSVLPQNSSIAGVEVLEDQGNSFAIKGLPKSVDAEIARSSGLGLLAYVGESTQEGKSAFGILNIEDPSQTGAIQQLIDSPGSAHAMALYRGYAYVAAGEAGLQVLPLASPDGLKQTPVVTLDSNLIPEKSVEGNLVRLTAHVTAVDQVSSVGFYIDGQKVASDGNYPFEYRVFDADALYGSSTEVYACAEDISGNSSCSTPTALTPGKKSSTLHVVSVTPTEGNKSPRLPKVNVQAKFSLSLDKSTVVPGNFTVLKLGKKPSQSSPVPVSGVSYDDSSRTVSIQSQGALTAGSYKVTVSSSIKSKSGAKLGSDYTWGFDVSGITDAWTSPTSGDWNTAANWSAGVPANGDSVVSIFLE